MCLRGQGWKDRIGAVFHVVMDQIRDFMYAEIVRKIPIFRGLETRSPWVLWRQSLERAEAIKKPSAAPIKIPEAKAVRGYPVM
jgi:hypothetical protein